MQRRILRAKFALGVQTRGGSLSKKEYRTNSKGSNGFSRGRGTGDPRFGCPRKSSTMRISATREIGTETKERKHEQETNASCRVRCNGFECHRGAGGSVQHRWHVGE